MAQQVDISPSRSGGRGRTRFGWRRLTVLGGLAVVASLIIPMLIQLSFEPFIVAMAAPVALGVLVLLRWPRVGAIWLEVVALGLLLFSAPFLLEALLHPEALADFIPLALFTVGCVVVAVSAIPAFRERREQSGGGTPRTIALVAAVVVVAASILSVVAWAGIESVEARGGDVLVVTQDIAFQQDQITVEGGEVAVHVENRDGTRHTFTIDELGVDLDIPPNTSQRTTFSAPPGTYRFYCRPHAPDMDGALVVT